MQTKFALIVAPKRNFALRAIYSTFYLSQTKHVKELDTLLSGS
jgi:hypothetical protein